MSKHNGIHAKGGIIKIKDLDEEVMLNVLFSSDSGLNRALTLEYWNTECKEDIPKGSLLIGDFQDGGSLLLIPTGEEKGVYYYNHAYSFDLSDDECNTYFLAETFGDFMRQLDCNH